MSLRAAIGRNDLDVAPVPTPPLPSVLATLERHSLRDRFSRKSAPSSSFRDATLCGNLGVVWHEATPSRAAAKRPQKLFALGLAAVNALLRGGALFYFLSIFDVVVFCMLLVAWAHYRLFFPKHRLPVEQLA